MTRSAAQDGPGQTGRYPDPARIASPQDAGRELTLARIRAGLTVREVAKRAGIPVSTAGDYFSGRHLPQPTQPDLLPRLLRACGISAEAELQGWADAVAATRRPPGRRPAATRPPYQGLASFQPADARWFFGRTALTDRLAAMATAAGADGRPLMLVGASGSGKSSLLRAGLIPRLVGPEPPGAAGPGSTAGATGADSANGTAGASGAGGPAGRSGRRLALLTPGRRPLAALAGQLAQLTWGETAGGEGQQSGSWLETALRDDPAAAAGLLPVRDPAEQPVIVADQFEEVFTDCPDEDERRAFIWSLCALSGRAVVAIALRADFYEHALRYPQLSAALQDRQVVLGPMSPSQVRSVILGPARLAGLTVADGLVELLLSDLAPRAASRSLDADAHEAGALPLLSHALLAAWEHSHGGQLTVADYMSSGGIKDAIARTAERVYADLDPDQHDLARQLFLRLVHVADDAPETRSTVRLADLPGGGLPGTPAGDLLDRFVRARLISTGPGTAQLTHDALLTAWPRLRGWIDDSHEDLRIRRRVSEAARAWAQTGRDDAALLRGGPLEAALEWADREGDPASLSPLNREFIATSQDQEDVRREAERRRTRRLHNLVSALSALVLVAAGLAVYAFQQRHAASAAQSSAMAASQDAQQARNYANSREVAIEAAQQRKHNVALAAQLSLAAFRIARTPQARSSLLDSTGTPAAAQITDSGAQISAVSLSPDHKLLAVAAVDGSLKLWDVANPGRPRPIGRPLIGPNAGLPLHAAVFSPDGRLLAVSGDEGLVRIWDVTSPARPVERPALRGPRAGVDTLAISRRGLLAVDGAGDRIRLWDIRGQYGARPVAVVPGPRGSAHALAFSPDGTLLAAAGTGRPVQLWHVTDPARPVAGSVPGPGPSAPVRSVAFSPTGDLLAAGDANGRIWLWPVTRAGQARPGGSPLSSDDHAVNAVAFSPDGRWIAAGGDTQAGVWDLASRTLTATLPHPQKVTSLTWDGRKELITGGGDGVVRAWALPSPVLLTGSPVSTVALSRKTGLLAAGGNQLQLWDPRTRQLLAARPAPGTGRQVSAVAFAPGSPLLAAGYGNGTFRLWDADRRLVPVSKLVRASTLNLVESVAFSPDGKVLATGGDDGTLRLWDVSNPAQPRQLAVLRNPDLSIVLSAAFSPDGTVLAAASSDYVTRLWDVSDPGHPHRFGRPLTGPSSYASSVAFSPDGRTLAIGSADQTVRLWDVSVPGRAQRLGKPLTGPNGYVSSVAFSPDSGVLAAGVTDGTVWMWIVRTPARPSLLATLSGPAHQVDSIAFSANGGTLAAGSADSTIRLWQTTPQAAEQLVCAMAGQPMSAAQWANYLPGVSYHPPCR
jgi:WD40 repeat protein/transcriptional regulator with XRE-family HTH domain